MPRTIDRNKINDTIVGYYQHVGNDRRTLKERVQAILPLGWTFIGNRILERDTWGPVTSRVMLKSPGGTLLSWMI